MSLQQPQDVDVPDPDLMKLPSQRDVPDPDANRDIVENDATPADDLPNPLPTHLPDQADPADAYEQSLAVVYDEEDYR